MQVPDDLLVVHQPARLALMTLLYQRGDVAAGAARDATGLTPGNMDSHARKLADAGLLEARKSLTREGFEVRYRITLRGLEVMATYLDWLQEFASRLQGAR